MARERRQTTQTIAWFRDLYKRKLLDLDPPYQRRSVWNQAYKDYFVDTILLSFPAPAVFLYENITADGVATYAVVDGKQRLSTIFDFVDSLYPVGDKCPIERLRGLYFEQLSDDEKKALWTYQFSVEYLPTTDESTLNNIFDRINRNVAKLTPQELRHARYSGEFATVSEDLAEFMQATLQADFPRIAPASKRQMKDVELVAQLLLFTERGVESYSQEELDAAYSARDSEWDQRQVVDREFRQVLAILGKLSSELLNGVGRRLRNQADFYSLYAATLELVRVDVLPALESFEYRLTRFLSVVADDTARETNSDAKRYYEAARSASNDIGQRQARIAIMRKVLLGAS